MQFSLFYWYYNVIPLLSPWPNFLICKINISIVNFTAVLQTLTNDGHTDNQWCRTIWNLFSRGGLLKIE